MPARFAAETGNRPVLLSREEFSRQVFARSQNRCVLCAAAAIDAHHIMERKLFSDGGYYLDNGAAVCAACHWRCETTEIGVDRVREACGITAGLLPRGWPAGLSYDKWGNRCWPSGLRSAGPLGQDLGMRKALARGGFLARIMPGNYTESEDR